MGGGEGQTGGRLPAPTPSPCPPNKESSVFRCKGLGCWEGARVRLEPGPREAARPGCRSWFSAGSFWKWWRGDGGGLVCCPRGLGTAGSGPKGRLGAAPSGHPLHGVPSPTGRAPSWLNERRTGLPAASSREAGLGAPSPGTSIGSGGRGAHSPLTGGGRGEGGLGMAGPGLGCSVGWGDVQPRSPGGGPRGGQGSTPQPLPPRGRACTLGWSAHSTGSLTPAFESPCSRCPGAGGGSLPGRQLLAAGWSGATGPQGPSGHSQGPCSVPGGLWDWPSGSWLPSLKGPRSGPAGGAKRTLCSPFRGASALGAACPCPRACPGCAQGPVPRDKQRGTWGALWAAPQGHSPSAPPCCLSWGPKVEGDHRIRRWGRAPAWGWGPAAPAHLTLPPPVWAGLLGALGVRWGFSRGFWGSDTKGMGGTGPALRLWGPRQPPHQRQDPARGTRLLPA